MALQLSPPRGLGEQGQVSTLFRSRPETKGKLLGAQTAEAGTERSCIFGWNPIRSWGHLGAVLPGRKLFGSSL